MKKLELLSSAELIEINGGHQGVAYEMGRAFGKALIMVGAVAFFFSPKS